MELIWNASIRETWDGFEDRQPRFLEQSWAYGQAMQAQGLGVQRVQLCQDGECLGQAQFITRRLLGYIGLAYCSRGPVWQARVPALQRIGAMQQLKKQLPMRPWKAVLFSLPATESPQEPPVTGRMQQVITGDSTVLIALQQDPDRLLGQLHSKWRNRLRQAQQQPQVDVFAGTDARRLQRLLQQEAQQRQAKRFHGLPLEFTQSFIDSHPQLAQGHLLCEARVNKQPLAGMLFLRHGRTATYHIGWLEDSARHMNLHNLLMWQAMQTLRQQGLHWLDLGGINTEDMAGISRFKLGTGGQVVSHPGTYF